MKTHHALPLAAASLLLGALSAPILHAADAAAPTAQKDKVSYSIGMEIGSKMKSQGVEVNPDQMLNGLKDGLAGTKPKLTQEDMQATMQAFASEMQGKMQAKMKAQGDENKAKGEAFLAENKKKEGWKTTASGLQYKELKAGTGEKPKATDTVTTNYRGTFIDGKEFDSSKEPADLPVDGVIAGWSEALQLMPVGAKWQLAIPSNLAYGENPPSPVIGPNSVLLFDLELLGIKKPDAKEAAGREQSSVVTPAMSAAPSAEPKK